MPSFILFNGLDRFSIDSDTSSVKIFAFSPNSSYFELYKLISLLTIFKELSVVLSRKSGMV